MISHSNADLQMPNDDSAGVCVAIQSPAAVAKQPWQVTVSSRTRWFLQVIFVILETRTKLSDLLVNTCTEYVAEEKLKARHQNVPAKPGISLTHRR